MSDDERRRVAERLRGDPYDTLIPYRTGIHFGMGCHEAASRFWDMCERIKSAGDYDIAYSTRSVLADLIEPGESGQNLDTNRDTVPKESPAVQKAPECDRDATATRDMSQSCRDTVACDREALLALAEEITESYVAGGADGDELVMSRGAALFVARRIREACGEAVE